MTVTAGTASVRYACSGGSTYPVTFPFFDTDEIEVILTDENDAETVLTETTDYSVAGGSGATGTVTTVEAYAVGYYITIRRSLEPTQEADFVEGDPFLADSIEDALDRIVHEIQQNAEEIDRCVKFPKSSNLQDIPLALPAPNTYLMWDNAASALTNSGSVPSLLTVADIKNIADYNDDLAEAVSTIGVSTAYLLIGKAITLPSSVTVPVNITLWITSEGSITLGAYDLTIQGQLLAKRYQIFDASGAGVVEFEDYCVDEFYPEWWGDDEAAFEAAMVCAVANHVPIKLARKIYGPITSTLYPAGAFDMHGVSHHTDELGSVLNYTGSGPMFKFTAVASRSRWTCLRIMTTDNENSDVDIVDFNYGIVDGYFESVDIDVTDAVRHGWILRGIPEAGGDANAAQWANVWVNCRTVGNVGICWYLYGQDVTNARCNNNKWIGGTTGASCETAFYVNGNGNSWFNTNVNAVTGTYAVKMVGDQTRDNNFFGVYFDSFSGKKIWLQKNQVANQAMANFYGCNNIDDVSDFEQWNLAGDTQNEVPMVNIFGSWNVTLFNDLVGSGYESAVSGLRVKQVELDLPAELTYLHGGTCITRNSGTDNSITLPEIGAGTGYVQKGWWVAVICEDASYPITIYPQAGEQINWLPAGQPIKIGNAGRYVVLEAVSTSCWYVRSTSGPLNVPIVTDTILGSRGCISDIFVFTNEGATTIVTVTLPSTVEGSVSGAKFMRIANYAFRVEPTTTFRGSSSGKYKSLDTQGAILAVRGGISNYWEVEYTAGTVSDET